MLERSDFMRQKYQQSIRQKQDKLRAKSTVNKTDPGIHSSKSDRGTNGFLYRVFMQRKHHPTENEEDTETQKDQPQEFKFSFFDQFCNEPVNITGEDQPMAKFRRLIEEHKTHQLQQIRLIDIPKSGEKTSLRFKQKVQIVLTHFFPYEILFTDKEYQLTMSNKVQHYSRKYKSFINLSNARTFLEDKNKRPSYVLLGHNVFQDLNRIKHQFDEILVGLVDGIFTTETVTAQKVKCTSYPTERIGSSSMHNWRNPKSFIPIISSCIHEVLHILQFGHCFKKKCIMNLRPNEAGLTMCSECLSKFCLLFKVDLKQWFGELSEVLRIIEESEEAQKMRQVFVALQEVEI